MTAVEILQETKHLLSKGWTKGTYATDIRGDSCGPRSPAARRFCLLGALYRTGMHNAEGFEGMNIAHNALHQVVQTESGLAGAGLSTFNDTRDSVEEVIEIIDKAIEKLSTPL